MSIVTTLRVPVTRLKRHINKKRGEVSEWPKEHAWKVCIPQGIEGSNPSLTAIYSIYVSIAYDIDIMLKALCGNVLGMLCWFRGAAAPGFTV